jgi:GGDEF domain-containing protein
VNDFAFTTNDGFTLRDSSIGPVRASIGYASHPEETAVSDELMDLADKRMYAAKGSRANSKLKRLPPP